MPYTLVYSIRVRNTCLYPSPPHSLQRVWPEQLGSRLQSTRVPLVALGTNPTLSANSLTNSFND